MNRRNFLKFLSSIFGVSSVVGLPLLGNGVKQKEYPAQSESNGLIIKGGYRTGQGEIVFERAFENVLVSTMIDNEIYTIGKLNPRGFTIKGAGTNTIHWIAMGY